MVIEFLVAIRNDQKQLLVLERQTSVPHHSVPTFPGGQIHGENLVRSITSRVLVDTGLSIGGLHFTSVKRNVHRYHAYVKAGKLVEFPKPADGGDLLSASWMAPSLILHLADASQGMRELCTELSWIQASPR